MFAQGKTPAKTPAQTQHTPVKEAAKETEKKKPTTAQLRTMVEQTLAKNPYYSPGFLISRRDVETLFSKLLTDGVTEPDDQEDLVETLLSDSSFLVGRLKTPVGRAFMKKIATDKTAYDRLERLSWSPDGRKLIDTIIAAKDGPAQLQQLQTAEQLAKISKRLAADPRTADFALPTNKAHTADELVTKLEEVLAAKHAAQ
ncbi:hypothetical protein [Anatilimnocola floriformis]|uniref:hypothetical protein n=1 Tax=Anatilimnocola floriformis TaxID=2948575 RepID=UPI0020C5179B|nr:hypothetical protein [Anatilimnocola floriformis]